MTEPSIGIMEGAFFVSKGDILQWVNEFLQLNLDRIEQLGTGAVYCQIMDSLFPKMVQMSKVQWKAKNEWEYINNFKILQQTFLKCKLNKYIDVEKLSKAKYQDNLEFAQWMKRFFDINQGRVMNDYDPVKARDFQQVDFSMNTNNNNKKLSRLNKPNSSKDKQNENQKINNNNNNLQQKNNDHHHNNNLVKYKGESLDMKNHHQNLKSNQKQVQKVDNGIEQKMNMLMNENNQLKYNLGRLKLVINQMNIEMENQKEECVKCDFNRQKMAQIKQILLMEQQSQQQDQQQQRLATDY